MPGVLELEPVEPEVMGVDLCIKCDHPKHLHGQRGCRVAYTEQIGPDLKRVISCGCCSDKMIAARIERRELAGVGR